MRDASYAIVVLGALSIPEGIWQILDGDVLFGVFVMLVGLAAGGLAVRRLKQG
jgi:hypothetical protein